MKLEELNNSKFTAADFIAFFDPIPDELWTTGVFRDKDNDAKCCALGHCGGKPYYSDTVAMGRLHNLFHDHLPVGVSVASVNDGKTSGREFSAHPTPKARVITALTLIQEQGG